MDFSTAMSDRLIEHRERIAHRAMRNARDLYECSVVEGDDLGLEDCTEAFGDELRSKRL